MIGANGLALIKHFESCRLVAFKPIVTDPWTIGFGRTHGVKAGDTCTQAQADQWLADDVADSYGAVARGISQALTKNQRDALTSFIYNCGETAFWASTLRRVLNEGQIMDAADQFAVWNKSKGVPIAGLTRRRAAERRLFLTPDHEVFEL